MPDYQIYIKNIKKSGLSLYDKIDIGNKQLYIPDEVLQILLNKRLKGLFLKCLPLRTRSKLLNSKICKSLGYKVLESFKKVQPRFYGQNLDKYIQKSNNLQIWNEEIDHKRRYAIIKLNANDKIEKVKIINGFQLTKFDTTGTLTQKYQARAKIFNGSKLLVKEDTLNMQNVISDGMINIDGSPTDFPICGNILPIDAIYKKLLTIIDRSFRNSRMDQERNRGGRLHKMVCKALGYKSFKDKGQFPDVLNQLLEIKLQTSPTIDLGLVCPDSIEPLDLESINGIKVRHCDIRYAVFCAEINKNNIKLKSLLLTTGERFFDEFKKFQGKVVNKKIQIPLPVSFFDL